MLGLGLGFTSRGTLQRSSAIGFPWPAAIVDLDFQRQRYFWNGVEKTTADFTVYTLNGSTFDSRGLTPTDTLAIELALAGIGGTVSPGSCAFSVYQASLAAAQKNWWQLDANVNNSDRINMLQQTSGQVAIGITTTSVTQAAITTPGSTGMATLNVKHGIAASYATNQVDIAANNIGGTPDTAATLPTVNRLRIMRSFTAANSPTTGALSRLVLFSATKTLVECQALSIAIRDAA